MSIAIFSRDEAYAVKTAVEGAFGANAFLDDRVPQDPNDEPASVLLERIRKERQLQEKDKTTSKSREVKSKEVTESPGVEGEREVKRAKKKSRGMELVM